MSKRKKKHKQNKDSPEKKIETEAQPAVLKNSWLRKIGQLILALCAIIPLMYFLYDRYLMPTKDKFDEERIITGEIESQLISSHAILESRPEFFINRKTYKYPEVSGIRIDTLSRRLALPVIIGGKAIICPVENFYQGINIFHPSIISCGNLELNIAAKEDRLFVSTKIIDYRSDNLLGEISYNKWKIYKEEALDYRQDDSKLEIIDKQGNIAFSISFVDNKYSSFLILSGYFVSPESVYILPNKYFDKKTYTNVKLDTAMCIKRQDLNWEVEAQKNMANIISVF